MDFSGVRREVQIIADRDLRRKVFHETDGGHTRTTGRWRHGEVTHAQGPGRLLPGNRHAARLSGRANKTPTPEAGPDAQRLRCGRRSARRARQEVVYLDQNWSPSESLRFYSTPARLAATPLPVVPRPRAGGLDHPLPRQPEHPQISLPAAECRARRIPTDSPSASPRRPARAVGGWASPAQLCHTNEIRLGDIGYRVDGAPTQADAQAFLSDLAGALQKTRDDPAKFARFAAKVLERNDPKNQAELKDDLAKVIQDRVGYNLATSSAIDPKQTDPQPPTRYGRLDAVDAIVNEAFWQPSSTRNPISRRSSPGRATPR